MRRTEYDRKLGIWFVYLDGEMVASFRYRKSLDDYWETVNGVEQSRKAAQSM